MTEARDELPDMPTRIARLPVEARGYPVPWFVAWLDENGEPVRRGTGTPDFRVLHPTVIVQAVNEKRCWICGGPMGRYGAFVIGPMCSINRVSAEPPSHRDCAEWSARACPFLSRPHARRREAGMPQESEEAAGIMLKRNPGVALVWVSESWFPFRVPEISGTVDGEAVRANGGVLFDVGAPVETLWFRESRPATREEVLESIESGLPSLLDVATHQGDDAGARLDRMRETAMQVIPT